MVVFVGNLPKTAVERDLCQIARLDPATPLRIIKKRARTGEMLRYALIPVTDGKQARRLISRLNGYGWQGQRLAARLYQPRVAGNEQRRIDWRTQRWIGVERRCTERRNRPAAPASRVA